MVNWAVVSSERLPQPLKTSVRLSLRSSQGLHYHVGI